MSETRAVNLTPQGPPSTVLPAESDDIMSQYAGITALPMNERRDLLVAVVMSNPRSLFGWACLGDVGRDVLERYAYYRIGYHRGLDALRQNGWRGSGYVRWSAPTNRGFLRCLRGLQTMAAAIGEEDEAERCALFLQQLDPAGVPLDG
ncbi:MAG: DUF3151 family protein [Ilumatobacteraceae bacterium]